MQPLRRTRLDVVYSSSLFQTINRNDGIAAMKVWVATIAQRRGFVVDCTVSVADDLASLKRSVVETPGGLFLVDPSEYFELAGLGFLQPTFSCARGDQNAGRFVLLARPDSASGGLAGLRAKTLTIEMDSRADLGRQWMELLLNEGGLGLPDRFFSSVTSVATPTAAVLPVFFGKTAARLSTRSGSTC
jgi:hypothetical protein